MKNNKIGFDLDGVFISLPPFIPSFVIDGLYKGFYAFRKSGKKNLLVYRYPGGVEKKIRILSHYPIFRKPILKNINGLRKLSANGKYDIFLVSSRFNFLEEKTNLLLEKYRLLDFFSGIHINKKDEQPHIYKEKMINRLKINKYIDDDLDLASYLANKIPNLEVYWIRNNRDDYKKIPSNLIPIKNVNEFIDKYL